MGLREDGLIVVDVDTGHGDGCPCGDNPRLVLHGFVRRDSRIPRAYTVRETKPFFDAAAEIGELFQQRPVQSSRWIRDGGRELILQLSQGFWLASAMII